MYILRLLFNHLTYLKVKISQLEETCEISSNQLKFLQYRQDNRMNEVKSLQEQIKHYQVKSDENAIISNLVLLFLITVTILQLEF